MRSGAFCRGTVAVVRTCCGCGERVLFLSTHMATTVHISEHKLLSARDVATMLGITQPTVYAHAKSGRLPAPMVVGSVYRWRREQIEKFLQNSITQ